MGISLWISVAVSATTALIISAHFYYKNAFKFWKERGINGPKALPFFGNYIKLLMKREAPGEWRRKFGKVYGVYEGARPVLVVSDAKLMGQICIKDFNKFPNHPAEPGSQLIQSFIFNARDDDWRHIRAIMSPSFSSGRMRRMFKLLNICANTLVEALDERLKSGPIVHLKDLFNLYTMDAIASCCYRIKMASYKNEASLATAANQDEFVKLAVKLFDFSVARFLVFLILPRSILHWLNFGVIPSKVEWGFANRMRQIIKNRQESGKRFDDYLQTLIDAQCVTLEGTKSSEDRGHLEDPERHHGGSETDDSQHLPQPDRKNKPLSEIEVLASATYLLGVGLESTSMFLTHCFYALAWHQEIQEKLYQEIKLLARADEHNKFTFDYESLTSCHYLDAVISETLRAQPPVMQNDRSPIVDCYLASHNLLIPRETKIVFTLAEIMNDEDYWPEPQVFNPDRFMPENRHKIVPNSYCPFGIGPRNCVAMRFSLTETKIAMAKLLMEYKFEPAPDTKYPPEPKAPFLLNNMKRPEVRVARR
jgi:cytochrome P450 family 3 subfamily A